MKRHRTRPLAPESESSLPGACSSSASPGAQPFVKLMAFSRLIWILCSPYGRSSTLTGMMNRSSPRVRATPSATASSLSVPGFWFDTRDVTKMKRRVRSRMAASMFFQKSSPPRSLTTSHHTRYPSRVSRSVSQVAKALSSGFAWLTKTASRSSMDGSVGLTRPPCRFR